MVFPGGILGSQVRIWCSPGGILGSQVRFWCSLEDFCAPGLDFGVPGEILGSQVRFGCSQVEFCVSGWTLGIPGGISTFFWILGGIFVLLVWILVLPGWNFGAPGGNLVLPSENFIGFMGHEQNFGCFQLISGGISILFLTSWVEFFSTWADFDVPRWISGVPGEILTLFWRPGWAFCAPRWVFKS